MYGKVGRITAAAGSINPLRTDEDGNLVVSAYGGKYADLVNAGKVFSVANQAAKSTTAALATTWTGLSIMNPSTSTVDLKVLEFGAAQLAVGVAGGIGLMVANTTGLEAELTPLNALRGSLVTSAAIADTAATIGTPILLRLYGSVGSLATTGYGLMPGLLVDLDGSIIVEPGFSLLTYTTAATTTALAFHFVWAEV